MAEKKTHFGRAGEYFAMSELLLRGWNVAVPVVDVGDDVFMIDDNDKTTLRLQVKAADEVAEEDGVTAKFTLSREQLRTPQQVELFFMLLIRLKASAKWHFFVLPREDLAAIHKMYVEAGARRKGRGRRPLAHDAAKTDALGLEVKLKDGEATGWGKPMTAYLDCWPKKLDPVEGGPGAIKQARVATTAVDALDDDDEEMTEEVLTTTPAANPAPSPDPEK